MRADDNIIKLQPTVRTAPGVVSVGGVAGARVGGHRRGAQQRDRCSSAPELHVEVAVKAVGVTGRAHGEGETALDSRNCRRSSRRRDRRSRRHCRWRRRPRKEIRKRRVHEPAATPGRVAAVAAARVVEEVMRAAGRGVDRPPVVCHRDVLVVAVQILVVKPRRQVVSAELGRRAARGRGYGRGRRWRGARR